MGTCMASAGFLTLSGCENPATMMCTSCGRGMCPAHLSPMSGFTKCLECGNRDDAALPPAGTGDTDVYDSDWSYRYRNSYYSDSGYRPHSDDWDSDDTSSFNSSADDRDFDDDAGGGGFGDS